MLTEENKLYRVICDKDGLITIINKKDDTEHFFRLFGDDYQYLFEQWCVEPRLFLVPTLEYLIVTYGIGYVYVIDLKQMEIVRHFKLFEGISYEDDSYQKIDTCCYYCETTEVDFSPSERYAILRVRGDYDPQDSDGRTVIFTPIYFSSVFVFDMHKLEVVFQYDGNDMQDGVRCSSKNMAVVAISPLEDKFLVGAPGNDLKMFSLNDGLKIQTFTKLAWIPDPCDIRKCEIAVFMENDKIAYLNEDYNIVIQEEQTNGIWVCRQIINTNYANLEKEEQRKIWTLNYDEDRSEFVF